jgi:hypothetical protein
MKRPCARLIEVDADGVRSGDRKTADAVAEAAVALDRGEVLILRSHPSDGAKVRAVHWGRTVLQALRQHLVCDWSLPRSSRVELDAESKGVPVAPFRSRRFLLPHQDGGHCSFLTPSRLDCADLSPGERVYSSSVYWRRPSHKMYQGFLVTSPGETPGTTFYYDALALLGDAFLHQRGRSPVDTGELAGFALQNLRRSRELQGLHGSRYLTLGAFLGAREPSHHVSPSGPRAESEFWPAQYLSVPNLASLADRCPCDTCDGPGGRLVCHACLETLGLSWPQVRARYETAIVAANHDLVIANNLTLYHAADSDALRTLVPMCIVTSRPEGVAYERWLARQWRVRPAMGEASAA